MQVMYYTWDLGFQVSIKRVFNLLGEFFLFKCKCITDVNKWC